MVGILVFMCGFEIIVFCVYIWVYKGVIIIVERYLLVCIGGFLIKVFVEGVEIIYIYNRVDGIFKFFFSFVFGNRIVYFGFCFWSFWILSSFFVNEDLISEL